MTTIYHSPISPAPHPRKLSPKTYPCRRRPPAKPPPATHPAMANDISSPTIPVTRHPTPIPSPQSHPTITTDRNPAPRNPSGYDNDISSPHFPLPNPANYPPKPTRAAAAPPAKPPPATHPAMANDISSPPPNTQRGKPSPCQSQTHHPSQHNRLQQPSLFMITIHHRPPSSLPAPNPANYSPTKPRRPAAHGNPAPASPANPGAQPATTRSASARNRPSHSAQVCPNPCRTKTYPAPCVR